MGVAIVAEVGVLEVARWGLTADVSCEMEEWLRGDWNVFREGARTEKGTEPEELGRRSFRAMDVPTSTLPGSSLVLTSWINWFTPAVPLDFR